MSLPSRLRSDLWRRLAAAQDASACDLGDRRLRDEGVALAARLAVSGAARSRYRVPVMAIGLGALVATVFLAGALTRNVSRRPTAGLVPLSLSPSPGPGVADRSFVADARSDLPLRFSDGSSVIFRAGSAGHIRRFTGAGAEIVLERGRVEAQVVHADTTLWLLHAGPYRVRVTGTRFAMTWAAATLEVDLFEGAVMIDGEVLGAGVPLRAGQRMKIASGTVRVEPLESPSSVAAPSIAPVPNVPTPAVPPPAPPAPALPPPTTANPRESGPVRSSGRPSDDQWLELAERGAYRAALSAANRLGWSDLCRHLDARRLLTLGDVARYSGAHAKARQAFESLVTRFPGDRLTADAMFSLGRLAFESRHPNEAARWFGRYVTDWPSAPLADQAAGRLLECAIRVDDRDAARTAARRYLARAPGGPHATLAREVLEQPSDGPP